MSSDTVDKENRIGASLRTRRGIIKATVASGVTLTISAALTEQLCAETSERSSSFDVSQFRTPFKYGKYILTASEDQNSFDSQFVLDPFVFRADGRFFMVYLGHDGTGYQTGLAESDDLIHWTRSGLILGRDPKSRYTRYNIAMSSMLRDDELTSFGELKKVNGRYLGSWHAYPNSGVESGAAVIGLAWSDDFRHWQLEDPILEPGDGASWERGGLYKSHLVKSGDTYYLFYNAKDITIKHWHEQIGVATSQDLKRWVRYSGNPIIRNGSKGSKDSRFSSNPFVVRRADLWGLFYCGSSLDDGAEMRELLSLGTNPFHFNKAEEVMVDIGPPGSLDHVVAHHGCLISWQGDVYHFYVGATGSEDSSSPQHGITVARSRPW